MLCARVVDRLLHSRLELRIGARLGEPRAESTLWLPLVRQRCHIVGVDRGNDHGGPVVVQPGLADRACIAESHPARDESPESHGNQVHHRPVEICTAVREEKVLPQGKSDCQYACGGDTGEKCPPHPSIRPHPAQAMRTTRPMGRDHRVRRGVPESPRHSPPLTDEVHCIAGEGLLFRTVLRRQEVHLGSGPRYREAAVFRAAVRQRLANREDRGPSAVHPRCDIGANLYRYRMSDDIPLGEQRNRVPPWRSFQPAAPASVLEIAVVLIGFIRGNDHIAPGTARFRRRFGSRGRWPAGYRVPCIT